MGQGKSVLIYSHLIIIVMELTAYLQQQYTPGTAASYGREIGIFLSNYPQAADAVYSDLLDYIGVLRQRYGNAQTLNRIVCSIKVYYDYLCYMGLREDHPGRNIRLRDQRSRDVQLQDLFSASDLSMLMGRKERFKALFYRNEVLIGLLVYQGLLIGEMGSLCVEEIDLEGGTVYIRETAVTNSRKLPLHANQVLPLSAYLEGARAQLLGGRASETLLISQRGQPMQASDISKHVKRRYGGMFQGRKVTAQSIRQSVIANLLAQGHDISKVQQFAGHRYPSSTERYRQDHVGRLQAVIDQYHPVK